MAKQEIIKIENFNVNALEEIKGKKELITKTVKENPFVEITDNKTYEEAKKSRTALRTLRTDFEKEEKTLLNAVKTKITEPIKEIYSEFKNEVSPHEEKQQTEVKRYEEVKEEEKREKERIEEARKQNHRNNLDLFFTHNKNLIENLTFEQLPFEIQFKIDDQVFSNETFEDFADVFESKIEVLKFQLVDKEKILNEREEIRLQQLKIEEERKETERISSIKKSIDYFYSNWVDFFSEMTFKNIKEITEKFENEKPLDCQEFQEEYAEKRAKLVRMLEAKTSLLQQAESQRIESEKIVEQQRQIEEQQKELEESRKSIEESKEVETENAVEIVVNEAEVVSEVLEPEFEEETSKHIKKGIEFEQKAIDLISNTPTWHDILQEYYSQSSDVSFNEAEQFADWLEENYEVPNKKS